MVYKTTMKKIPILLLLSLLVIASNLFYMGLNLFLTLSRPPVEHPEPGIQFLGIKEKLKAGLTVGYLTNRDLSPEKNDQEFLQAQYMLAPTILDVNNPRHEFNILDFTDLKYTVYAVKTLHLKPIYDQFGKVLATYKTP